MSDNSNHKPASLNVDCTIYETSLTDKYKKRKRYEPENLNNIKAFIPGIIKSVDVKLGQFVNEGDELLVLEAMKMENQVLSPKAGIVKEIYIEPEQMVMKGQLLIELEDK